MRVLVQDSNTSKIKNVLCDAADEFFIRKALFLARQSENQEIPIGAVLTKDGTILGEGFNCPVKTIDPTAHAEMLAIREAARNLGNYRLLKTTLYVTLEPCLMCLGAIVHARIQRLVFGAFRPLRAWTKKEGCRILDELWTNHRLSWKGGILSDECSSALKEFFRKRR
ncbi:nucleoside deaminase [Coxiella endosymbiont of Amblyomma sculptum]|uniref:tRNA adenosine(34) deaminase TadA n=1 Tax=Coxiella endosymbiont of Amblyomma sculptum TaxID=2487929 RepID=UPI00132EB97C|nr:tRNA adenosine(34) deaminase TadA [Coxiella endosymbiont of Amblyomma sculptum]QHG92343.1 nucleoside deaminase [Coxiella endosymbiont of Amblyomma sculptum]